jgi:hypothetical protein
MMAALSGFDLAVSPFLNLAMSRLSIAGFPFQSLSLSCSPETNIRADFCSRLGAGQLNLAA